MSEEGYESIFNEAALKMKRIHEEQELINSLMVNLLMHNSSADKYNYEVVISKLFNLLGEVWGKLSVKEKEYSNKWKELLINLLEYKPVYSIDKHESLEGTKKYIRMNTSNWKVTREVIFRFNDLIKELLEAHGMSGKNETSEAGWD